MCIFFYPSPVYWITVMRAVCACQQIKRENKNSLAWTAATLLCPIYSRSVDMKPSAQSLCVHHMLRCTQLFIISRGLNCKHAISCIIPGLNLIDLMSSCLFIFKPKTKPLNRGTNKAGQSVKKEELTVPF